MFDVSRSSIPARRTTGATIATVVVHGLLVLVITFVFTHDTARVDIVESPRPVSTLVFLQTTGPGGGGGGSPEPAPPRPIEVPRTRPPAPIPVEIPPPVAAPPPPPPPRLSAPVMTPDAISLQASGSSTVSLGAPGGGGRGTGAGPGRGDGVGEGSGGNVGGGLARPGAGVDGPVLVRERKPDYTAEALRARIQGQVELQAVVLEDGTIGDVMVVKSLDRAYGLDLEAMKAARQWRFLPARQSGRPVRMAVTMFLDFRIN